MELSIIRIGEQKNGFLNRIFEYDYRGTVPLHSALLRTLLHISLKEHQFHRYKGISTDYIKDGREGLIRFFPLYTVCYIHRFTAYVIGLCTHGMFVTKYNLMTQLPILLTHFR